MKRKAVLCALALVIAIGSALAAADSASSSPALSEKAVTARSLAFVKAARNGDVAGFGTFMLDGYVMLWVEPASNGTKAHWATKTKGEWVEEAAARAVASSASG